MKLRPENLELSDKIHDVFWINFPRDDFGNNRVHILSTKIGRKVTNTCLQELDSEVGKIMSQFIN